MQYLQLLVIMTLVGSLPLLSCVPTATSLATATAAQSSSDSKQSFEKYSIVRTGKHPVSVTFCPLGKLAAVANHYDDTMSVYTVDATKGIFRPIHDSPIATGKRPVSIAFSPDVKLATVINSDYHTVNVYKVDADAGTLTPIDSPFNDEERWPRHVAFCPQGKLVVVFNQKLTNASLSSYRVDTNSGIFTEVEGSPFALHKMSFAEKCTFTPDGKLLAVLDVSEMSVYQVDAQAGTFTPVHGSPFATGLFPVAIAFSPDTKLAAVVTSGNSSKNKNNNGSLNVYKIDTNNADLTLMPISSSPFTVDALSRVEFSPNGKFLVVVNLSEIMSVYKVDSQKNVCTPVQDSLLKVEGIVHSVSFSPVNALAAVAHYPQSMLSIYKFDDESEKFTPITGGILPVVQRKEELKKAKEAFEHFAQENHALEEGKKAGFGENLAPIEHLIALYLLSSNWN